MGGTILALWVMATGAAPMPTVSARGQQAVAPARPNVVFNISEDHRRDALGAAGSPKIKTPVPDRPAA